MFGRSKPQNSTESSKDPEEDDFINAEISFFKSKNSDLAKALAEAKMTIKQCVDEKEFLQRQVLSLHMRNSELLNSIRNIDEAARKSINAIVVSSNYITEIAHAVSLANIRKSESTLNYSHTAPSPSSGRMQAVRPMVDGHVIYRPIINLRRVNEIPHEELQMLESSPLNEIGNSMTPNQDDAANISSFHRLSTNAITSLNEHSNHTPVNGLGDGVENEYDQSPSNVPETEHINSRLQTIEELSESMIDSSRSEDSRTTITSPGMNPVNISSHNPQVPLLSGVFRDVRVYLSPMQNISQYLESLQGITAETRKLPNVQKKHYSPRTVSLDENNQCVVTLTPSTCIESNDSHLPSANNSFEDGSNSILSSTRIASNFDESYRERNSEFVNKCRWPNKVENTTSTSINKKVHWSNGNNSKFNTSSSCSRVQDRFLSGETYSSTSFCTPTTVSTAYDPLEGPSSLLDSHTTTKEKLETLSNLGLKPKFSLESLPRSPSSPATAVLKRRERNQQDNGYIRQQKSIFVTKRNLDIKKPTISSKVAKRLSKLPLEIKQSLVTPDITESTSFTSTIANQSITHDSVKKKIKVKPELISPEIGDISTTSTPSRSSIRIHRVTNRKQKNLLNSDGSEVPKKKKKGYTKKTIISSKVAKRLSKSPLKIKTSLGGSRDITESTSLSSTLANQSIKRKLVKKKIKVSPQLVSPRTDNTSVASTPSHSSIRLYKKPKGKRKTSLNSNGNEVPTKKKRSTSPQKTPKVKRQAVLKGKSLKEVPLNKKLRRS